MSEESRQACGRCGHFKKVSKNAGFCKFRYWDIFLNNIEYEPIRKYPLVNRRNWCENFFNKIQEQE